MGRPRIKDNHLPRHVYRRGQTFYHYSGSKWLRLGKSMQEVYTALAQLEGTRGFTLGSIIDRYEAEVLPKQSANTQRNRLWQGDKLRLAFGHCHPDSVTRTDIYTYLDKRSKKVSANREISYLSSVYKYASRKGLANTNPCTGIEYHKEKPRDRYVTDDEFWAVWAVAPEQVQLYMELALITGQRLSDVLAMRWDSVTKDGLLVKQGKTGKRLCITLSPQLKAVLKRAKNDSPYILASKGQRITHFAMGAAFRRAHNKANLADPYTLHDIRAKAGSDSTGEVLGHMDTRTLHRVYKRRAAVVAPVRIIKPSNKRLVRGR